MSRENPLIIDCHGHYTTAPAPLTHFRDMQVAHFRDPLKPAPEGVVVSDDEIRETIEKNFGAAPLIYRAGFHEVLREFSRFGVFHPRIYKRLWRMPGFVRLPMEN